MVIQPPFSDVLYQKVLFPIQGIIAEDLRGIISAEFRIFIFIKQKVYR
jgi:hypothetical protein